MTSMTDQVRILLKAYGKELTVEQINKVLAGKNQKRKDDVKNAISELLSTNTITQVNTDSYKISDENRPNFFFVFQNKTYVEEQSNSCLFCSYSPDNRTIPHWETIAEVKKGDIIFHENDTICAISEAQDIVHDADRPYPTKEGTFPHGRKLNVMYTILVTQIEPKKIIKELYENEPEKTAPFDKSGRGHEGYLFYFNEKCSQIVIEGIINNAR